MRSDRMAHKLGYEFLNPKKTKGQTCWKVRKYGTTETIIIGYNSEQAQEWLIRQLDWQEEAKQNVHIE